MADNLERIQDNLRYLEQSGASNIAVQTYLKEEGFTVDRVVDAFAKKREAGPVQTEPGPARLFAQGATLGSADEIEALARGLIPALISTRLGRPLSPTDARTAAEGYGQTLSSVRLANQEYQRTDPFKAGVAEIAGAVVPAVGATLATLPAGGAGGAAVAGPAIIRTAPAVIPTMARAGLLGGAEGAVGGFMSGEGNVGSRLESAAAPGAAGLVLGPLVPAAGRTFGVAKTLVDPFFQAGKERLAGSVLNRFATNPSAAMQRLLQGGSEIVPGSRPMTSGIARDPGLAALQTPIRSTLDTENLIAARASEQNTARMALLDRMAFGSDAKALQRANQNLPGPALDYATAKRAAVTRPMRQEAFDFGGAADGKTLVGQIDDLLANPDNKRDTSQNALNAFKRKVLSEMDPDTGTIDPRTLYSIRKDVDLAQRGQLQGDQSNSLYAASVLGNLKSAFDDTIETAAPGYREYMDQFRKMSIPIDQMTGLQAVRRQAELSVPDVATGLPVLSQAGFKRALASRADDLARLSPSQRANVNAIMVDLNRAAAPTAPGVMPPGSSSIKNLSVANIIGNMFGESVAANSLVQTVVQPINWLYKMPEGDVQRLLVDAMLDPRLAGQLMQKAGAGVPPATARALARKAYDVGLISAGTYIGAAAGVSLDGGQ
jgi:hypothetical protein